MDEGNTNPLGIDWTEHKDPAGKFSRQRTDAGGRLAAVTEDPYVQSLSTAYTYNALDDLVTVTQGSQTRTFVYDSLKLLRSAANPESGTITYTYDDNGNLSQKAAPGVITTLGYDELDRLLTTNYGGGTPNVTQCYDGKLWSGIDGICNGSEAAPSIGRRTSVGSSASNTSYTYNAVGQITASTQTTGSQPYTFQYTYNLGGLLTRESYPSGRSVALGYDNAGRAEGVSGKQGTAVTKYAGSCDLDVSGSAVQSSCSANPVQYTPHGAILSLPMGSGITESWVYDPQRLQPTSIQAGGLFTLNYSYGPGSNNGNVQTQTITRGSQSWSQTYAYDALNRLTSATESGSGTWSQTYGYDAFGNRWVNGTNLPQQTNQVPNANWYLLNGSTNNQVLNSPSGAWTYDARGNLQAMAGMPGWGFTYDAENRQITADTANSPTTKYAYDGDGRRVSKTWNGQTTTFVYDGFGNLAAEYGGPPNTNIGTQYLTSDHLGSTRLVTDSSGVAVKCYDYLPFGEEIGNGTAGRGSCFGSGSYPVAGGATNREFTSKERDAETGLDYFGARYYSGAQGRFTSPDPMVHPGESQLGEEGFLSDPQRWNKYAYTRNNPLRYVDPDGYELTVAAELQQTVTTMRQESPAFNAELAAHEGNGPNLNIKYGATPNDPGGQPSIGNTNATISIVGIEPMPAPFEDWSSGTQYGGYKGATVTISNTIKGEKSEVESTMAHEVGHVNDARTNTDNYGKQGQRTKETHGATPHDNRPEEKTANKFKAKVAAERQQTRKQQKEEKKREKHEE